mgnify:CR=1 FL=1
MVDFPEAEVMAIINEEAKQSRETNLWRTPYARLRISKLLIDLVLRPQENPNTPIDLLYHIFDAHLTLSRFCTTKEMTFVFRDAGMDYLITVHAEVLTIIKNTLEARWLWWAQDAEIPYDLGELVLTLEEERMTEEANGFASRGANTEARVSPARFVEMNDLLDFCRRLLLTLEQSQEFIELYNRGIATLRDSRPFFDVPVIESTNEPPS